MSSKYVDRHEAVKAVQDTVTWTEEDSYKAQVDLRKRAAEAIEKLPPATEDDLALMLREELGNSEKERQIVAGMLAGVWSILFRRMHEAGEFNNPEVRDMDAMLKASLVMFRNKEQLQEVLNEEDYKHVAKAASFEQIGRINDIREKEGPVAAVRYMAEEALRQKRQQ